MRLDKAPTYNDNCAGTEPSAHCPAPSGERARVPCGDSEFAARFPSAVASILTVVLVFALARRIFGPAAGLATAVVVTVNPFQIWHAQTVRMYALSTTLAVATTFAL